MLHCARGFLSIVFLHESVWVGLIYSYFTVTVQCFFFFFFLSFFAFQRLEIWWLFYRLDYIGFSVFLFFFRICLISPHPCVSFVDFIVSIIQTPHPASRRINTQSFSSQILFVRTVFHSPTALDSECIVLTNKAHANKAVRSERSFQALRCSECLTSPLSNEISSSICQGWG